jgi:tetratricopeptide (TPR) repeat protein
MKKTILILAFSFLYHAITAQDKAGAEKLVEEGIIYHDKGDYDVAVAKYNNALELDKDNAFALMEKAMSLLHLQKYEESIQCCEKVIKIHPDDPRLNSLYVTYGTVYDALGNSKKSIQIYDKGIKRFPDYYQLYYNKGVTLAGIQKFDEAILCFQESVTINPEHASSHNGIARLENMDKKKIPALLAYSRFLLIEQDGNRAKENLAAMQKLMQSSVDKTGDKSVTINISSDLLDISKNGKAKENSFNSTELILTMDAALDYDEKNLNKTAAEQFLRKIETVCASLSETQKGNHGFYWDYYAPYFIEMRNKKFLETFSYIIFTSSGDRNVSEWLDSHKQEVSAFSAWSGSFKWMASQ